MTCRCSGVTIYNLNLWPRTLNPLSFTLPWGPDDPGASLPLWSLHPGLLGKNWSLCSASADFHPLWPFPLLSSLSFLSMDRAANQLFCFLFSLMIDHPSFLVGSGSFQFFLQVVCHLPAGVTLLVQMAWCFIHFWGSFFSNSKWLTRFSWVALSSGRSPSSTWGFSWSHWISLPRCEFLDCKHAWSG